MLSKLPSLFDAVEEIVLRRLSVLLCDWHADAVGAGFAREDLARAAWSRWVAHEHVVYVYWFGLRYCCSLATTSLM